MTVVAAWIVRTRPAGRDAAARALARVRGARVTAGDGGLVVSAECADADLSSMQESLAAAPGVLSVSLVAAYRDEEAGGQDDGEAPP
ncbi:MAG TPA: chaperone NapD [Candidatus Polarisedimenticolia bacterium]|nr:chaperone NapD [Candidatus Polarisedimenticolia bacterium]